MRRYIEVLSSIEMNIGWTITIIHVLGVINLSKFGENLALIGILVFMNSALSSRLIASPSINSHATKQLLGDFVGFTFFFSIFLTVLGIVIFVFSKDSENHEEKTETQSKKSTSSGKVKFGKALFIVGIIVDIINSSNKTLLRLFQKEPIEETMRTNDQIDVSFVLIFFISYAFILIGGFIWGKALMKKGKS